MKRAINNMFEHQWQHSPNVFRLSLEYEMSPYFLTICFAPSSTAAGIFAAS